jgi:hexosaminidase
MIPPMTEASENRLPHRGFMLDISRDRVPKRQTLEWLVRLLGRLEYTELQLYTEHTFAYREHKRVWQAASPMTAEDYQWLDKRCAEAGLELVPNQNCFGHFERWLKHAEYRHLAESPDGFDHPMGFAMESGSVLHPGEESLQFIASLLQELVPHFCSDQVNIGCDETWELGEGRSRAEAEQMGKAEVYLRQLLRILGEVEGLGKRPQFWADILLKEPDSFMALPKNAIPLIWGYEASHPFADQCASVAGSGLAFRVVPGTSSWNSFSHRWITAKAAIDNALGAAVDHRAEGFLLTCWGDNGHHTPLTMALPAIVYAAERSRTDGRIDDTLVIDRLHAEVYPDSSIESISALLELGELEPFWETDPVNMSRHWWALVAPLEQLQKARDSLVSVDLFGLQSELNRLRAQARGAEPHLHEDLELGIGFMEAAADRVRAVLRNGGNGWSFPGDLLTRYRRQWERSSRPGGFADSSGKLKGEGLRIGA